jgi:hypothetical protein
VIDREPAPVEVLLLWGVCHVEWLSEGWYICHNKQMQLWHVTFATRASDRHPAGPVAPLATELPFSVSSEHSVCTALSPPIYFRI